MEERLLLAAVCALAGAVSLLAMAGCGENPPATADVPAVNVKERDFEIRAPDRIAAGDVELDVHNDGPDAHELVVARKGSGPLPIGPDGINVNQEGLGDNEIAELEPEEPGTRRLRLHLYPGRYVLFCNMSGHYKGGMHTEVLVR